MASIVRCTFGQEALIEDAGRGGRSLRPYVCLLVSGRLENRRELLGEVGGDERLTDGEILELLFERRGDAAVERIAGSCSFVLRDRRRDRFLAVADRSGQTRLYSSDGPDGILLSPSVEALMPVACRPAALDRAVVAMHVCGSPPPPGQTFFAAIRAVPPGHLLVIGRGGVALERYWRPEESPMIRLSTDDEYAEKLWGVLQRVASEQLVAGEAAVTLSGGLDSPTVAAVVRSLVPDRPLVAIRVVARDLGDSPRSAEIAAALALESHEIDLVEGISPFVAGRLPTRRSTPYLEMQAGIQRRLLARARSLGASAIFTGLGGDELFAGGSWCYPDLLLTGRWRDLAGQMKEESKDRGESLVRLVGGRLLYPLLASFAKPILRPFRTPVRPVPWLGNVARSGLRALDRSPIPFPVTGRRARLARLARPGPLQMIEGFVESARGQGLEVCTPFFDHRVREVVLGLPTSQICRAGCPKIVLRRVLRQVLPARLVDSLKKHFVGDQFAALFRGAEAVSVKNLMTDMRGAELGFVDERALRRDYDRFVAGEHRNFGFWPAVTLEAWLREHF